MNKSKLMRSPRSPLSPRLRPSSKSPQLKAKLDKIASTYVSMAGKRIKALSPALPTFSPARSPGVGPVSSSNVLYLDVHDNMIQADSLKSINPNIFILNLANNPLQSCSFPSFQKLRTLSLDNCGLTSFEGFPFLPKLTYLSATGNSINSFKGLKILPSLEIINLIGNPVENSLKMIIAAVGSFNLKTINKKVVNSAMMKLAFSMSPLVGYSLRSGRSIKELRNNEEETMEAQKFLSNDFLSFIETQKYDNPISSLSIEPTVDGHAIVLPYKVSKIKWYKSHSPNEKGLEWHQIPDPKIPTVLPITMSVRLHLVRCDFTLDNKPFSIYTDDIIGRDIKDLALPYPIDPVIAGTPIECSLVSLLPLPFPARIAWVRENETIAQDVYSIMLTSLDIGKSVACLLQPYCPIDNTLTFGTIFTASETVAPLLPIVTGVKFPESVMEGQVLHFKRVMNPDREGNSQITIERALSQYGEWFLAAELKKEDLTYATSSLDVDHYLRICYTPITTEGTAGATCYFYCKTKIIPTLPTFYNPAIGGIPKTFFPLVALADYSGGQKGACTYDWYFSKRPIDVKKGPSKRLQKVAHNSQYFSPTANMADGFLAVEMVPVRVDEVVGDPVFVALESPILLDDAPKPLDNCPTDAIVGRTLKFPVVVEMYLSKPTGFCGFDLLKTGQTYTPREKHVGRILRIVTENNDVMIGEIKPATPIILDVSISADKWNPGELVSLSIKHKHLMPDKVEIAWLRCSPDFEIPVSLNNPEYVVQAKDIGYYLRAIVTPMDHTGKRLESKSSPNSPFIKQNDFLQPRILGELIEDQELTVDCAAEISSLQWYRVEGTKLVKISTDLCITLTTKEVGYLIRAKIILAGSGMVLNATSISAVLPSEPTVTIMLPPNVNEGDLISPDVCYHGGIEGQSIIRWYRETEDGWEIVQEGSLKYKVSIDDIDCVLRLVYIPIRNDRERGEQFVAECGPVDALSPSVTKVKMIQNSVGNIQVVGEYHGGFEGQSFIIWRVYNDDGTTRSLGKTVEKEMAPNPEVLGKRVDAIYVPIRNDGMAGPPVIASNQIVPQPLPNVLSADILVKGGILTEGALMRCRTTLSPGATPKFQWHRGDGKAWEIIEGATNVEYTTAKEDVGFLILCSVIAVDQKGWPSPAFAAATASPISKKKQNITIVEQLTPDGKLITGSMLSTNLELDQLTSAKLRWQKMINGEWKSISSDDTYLLSINDVGEKLRVISAKTGQTSEPSKVVELDPTVASYVRAIVKSGQMKVKARAKIGVVIWSIIIDGNIMTLKSKNGTQKSSKLSIVSCDAIQGSPDEMMLWLDPSSKFALIPDISDDKRLETLIKKENARDFVVAAIRGFINKK